MGYTPHRDEGVVAALDVGTARVACLIARLDGHGGAEVLGAAQQESQGVKAGLVADLPAAQGAVRRAVHTAEGAAAGALGGYPLRDVILATPALYSQTVRAQGWSAPAPGRTVTQADATRALADAQDAALKALTPGACELIHAIPAAWALDGHAVAGPVGLAGQDLCAEVDLVTAEGGPVRSLAAAVGAAHLTIAHMALGPYAAGLACLALDEADLGATVIDLGAGTTSFATFAAGTMVFSGAVALGSGHITADIARGLTTPRIEAERIKVLYGSAMTGAFDNGEMLEVPPLGEEGAEPRRVARSVLIGIIQPRAEEILEAVRAQLSDAGVSAGRVVLAGGGAQLPGMRELAQHVLDRPVRLGRPLVPQGLPDAARGPGFAVAAGLLAYLTARAGTEAPAAVAAQAAQSQGWAARAWAWLKENW
ncbi:MAG TPA: cell division protein FtsA [Rhodospirillaceae bacterium]|jgi:cell division protein FtsA|nr:cell division protein FtsA [Alphaproteobacteria bacterium]HBH27136.1 cell division protein FtsA [Rhodospirillaceae bacterium]